MHLAIIKNQGPIVFFFFPLVVDDALFTVVLFLKAGNKSPFTIGDLLAPGLWGDWKNRICVFRSKNPNFSSFLLDNTSKTLDKSWKSHKTLKSS